MKVQGKKAGYYTELERADGENDDTSREVEDDIVSGVGGGMNTTRGQVGRGRQ